MGFYQLREMPGIYYQVIFPVARAGQLHGLPVGLPRGGFWREVLNSDAEMYGGSNQGNLGGVQADDYQVQNQPFSAPLTLPPTSVVVFRPE